MRRILTTALPILLPTWVLAQDVTTMTTADLIKTYVAIEDELRKREVSASGSHLTGQLGEYLFTKAFGWAPAAQSQAAFDARDGARRVQIKARRMSDGGGNQQLGAIRDLDGFDVLAVVLFGHDYEVVLAALVPVEVVRAHAKHDAHTNVTDRLRAFRM